MITCILKRCLAVLPAVFTVVLSVYAQEPAEETPLNEAHFASTHNSYAGDVDGNRGSIVEQLDSGIRCLELDIHSDDFETHGYRIGHDKPGDRVFHQDENPVSNRLTDWLLMITNWSDRHPTHAPITLYLDLKDKFGSNSNDGNLAQLNSDLRASLGSHLFEARELGQNNWPSVRELRGKILVVLTGERANRLNYLRDQGASPAVAVNDSNAVVEIHDSGDGDLWYWTGRLLPDRSVEWLWHGQYAKGRRPGIAVNIDGSFVEAHRSSISPDAGLVYMVGQLDSILEISWVPAENVPSSHSIRTAAPSAACFNNDSDTLIVSTRRFGPFDSNTLVYRVNSGDWRAIRYSQVAFWEYSDDLSEDVLTLNPRFIAADAKDAHARQRAENLASTDQLVRLWRFDDPDDTADSPVNFPSTDFPYATWYTDYCRRISCVE